MTVFVQRGRRNDGLIGDNVICSDNCNDSNGSSEIQYEMYVCNKHMYHAGFPISTAVFDRIVQYCGSECGLRFVLIMIRYLLSTLYLPPLSRP